MALNLPVFYKRTASAIVFAAIMLAGLLWNDIAFIVLISLIGTLCLRDYMKLMQKIDKEAYWPAWVPALTIVLSLAIIFLFAFQANAQLLPVIFFIFMLFPVIPAILLMAGALSKKASLLAMLQASGGIFYITLPMLFLLSMHTMDFVLPIALILMIWSNDTMAYLVGSFIGKHTFSPISPNKTWEGVIGGVILTIIGAAIYGYYSHTYRMADWMALALCATVAGTLGDLLESKLKRLADVKDSGTLMPGHGGALDRFDSLLIAAPFAFVYVNYFMK